MSPDKNSIPTQQTREATDKPDKQYRKHNKDIKKQQIGGIWWEWDLIRIIKKWRK